MNISWIGINAPFRTPIKVINDSYGIFEKNIPSNECKNNLTDLINNLEIQICKIVPSFNVVHSRILYALLKIPANQHGEIVSLYSNNKLIPLCNDMLNGLTWYINGDGQVQVNDEYLVANNIFDFFLQMDNDVKVLQQGHS